MAAGTAVGLTGTGSMDQHGMIAIPALHDAANDQPIPFTPVCSHASIPVCLNPAYASYLTVTAAALKPVLDEIAGVPGGPVRVLQQAETYGQGPHNGVYIKPAGPSSGGSPPVYHLVFPYQLPGPVMSAGELASQVAMTDGANIVADFTGDGPGASAAQGAVAVALMLGTGRHLAVASMMNSENGPYPSLLPGVERGTPTFAAAQRFAALPASVRHAWLAGHLAALRAGQITLAQLP